MGFFKDKNELEPLTGMAKIYFDEIQQAFFDGGDYSSAFRQVAKILGEIRELLIIK